MRLAGDSKNILKRKVSFFIAVFSLLGASLVYVLYTHNTNAIDGLNWMQSPGQQISSDDPTEGFFDSYNCNSRSITVSLGLTNETRTECVTEGKYFRIVAGNPHSYISFGLDAKFYRLQLPSNHYPSMVKDGKRLFLWKYVGPHLSYLKVYNNSIERFLRHENGSMTYYTFNDSDPSYPDTSQFPSGVPAQGWGPSANEKYLVYARSGAGYQARVIKTDLDTGQARIISLTNPTVWYTPWHAEFGVSDSGRYVVAQQHIIDTNGCSIPLYEDNANLSATCPSQQYQTDVTCPSVLYCNFSKVQFIDEYKFTVLYEGYPDKKLTITANGYDNSSKLDYLAMGDSYSSGEGDIERNRSNNKKYYRQGTNVDGGLVNNVMIPQEKCHVSTRSYPYLLAQGMALDAPLSAPTTRWQSIACSGATAWDVKKQGSGNYMGQNTSGGISRLNASVSPQDLRTQALNEFIPGRQKQIEFLKKYKPRAITLTVGGNDIGFGEKIKNCVNIGTCVFASYQWRSNLKIELASQFTNLKDLYEELHNASPQTKIYVLGYPQFINADPNGSCSRTLFLDKSEREMIVNSTTYLNNIIEQAAKAAGVIYVDIENSLQGGMLCQGSQAFVTPVTGILANEQQESFHPNAKGNLKIATKVKEEIGGESLLEYQNPNCSSGVSVCPNSQITSGSAEVPEYFLVGESEDKALTYYPLSSGVFVKGQSTQTTVLPYMFKPESPVTIIVYSDPLDLGIHQADDDGSFSVNITIPDTLPVGYHTLTIIGHSYSGEPLTFYQTIEVHGTNQSDLDENNIPDTQQTCGLFIELLGVDNNLNGIDDICDPDADETAVLYRVRTGDTTRTYNGTSEQEDYLYIERNTRASSITGVTDDSDPDGDGWAIVGASQGLPYTTTTIPDTGPAANFIVDGEGIYSKPYVYIRAGGYGCVPYTPVSLLRAEEGQNRVLKRTSTDVDKCRYEYLSDDLDFNGVPDNEQLLYSARNGDVDKNEDPTRIYLFRSFHASETQLGTSDYSPTGTTVGNLHQPIQPWNLLATSKQNEYIPPFNKLVILSIVHPDNPTNALFPIILTKKQNNQCIAYQPESTGIIKMTTQQTRTLVKLAQLPEGVECE